MSPYVKSGQSTAALDQIIRIPIIGSMLLHGISNVWKTGTLNEHSVLKHLPDGYTIEQKNNLNRSGILKDTFDGHLRRKGKILLQESGTLSLFDLKSCRMNEQGISNDWKFAANLEDGPVRFQCLECSKLRAFSEITNAAVSITKWAIRDELEKTVVRLQAINLTRGSRSAVWVHVDSLRGYTEEARLVFQALEKSEYSTGPFDYFPMVGIRSGLYESKPNVDIQPKTSALDNSNRIVQTFLKTARKNEKGIIADVDTEFLHDYRVSLRRVRSLLSLFKGVYATAFNQEVKAELAQTMKQTNRLRDLDVYLLDRSMYFEMVPESLFGGLNIMFQIFSNEREEALASVRAELESDGYNRRIRKLMDRFQTLKKNDQGPVAHVNTDTFAKKLILKRYRKISAIASGIGKHTPESEVHELRIQCKKLRYLMEFFIPLFPMKKIKPLIKSLKGLQDVLGRFNDYCVQRESLSSFVWTHPMRGKKGLQVAESVGALVATLFQLQKKARKDVERDLELFVNKDTTAAFEVLFARR